jgi:hypothetical protein
MRPFSACLIHSLTCCQDFFFALVVCNLGWCFWLIVWIFLCYFIVVHLVLHGNFLGVRVCYRCLAIRALFNIYCRFLVVERLWDTNNSSACCLARNFFMSLWSSCGFFVVPIINKRLHGLEQATAGQALVGFCGSKRLCGLGRHSWEKFVSMHAKFFVQGSILESK